MEQHSAMNTYSSLRIMPATIRVVEYQLARKAEISGNHFIDRLPEFSGPLALAVQMNGLGFSYPTRSAVEQGPLRNDGSQQGSPRN
jgi:hypothetical protein